MSWWERAAGTYWPGVMGSTGVTKHEKRGQRGRGLYFKVGTNVDAEVLEWLEQTADEYNTGVSVLIRVCIEREMQRDRLEKTKGVDRQERKA